MTTEMEMIEIVAKKEWLDIRINELIISFEKRRLKNRQRSFSTYIIICALGAVSTIVLGLGIEELKDYFRIVALILSAIISIFSAYSAFYNNRNLWIKYTKATNLLKSIRDEFHFYLAGKNDNDIELRILEEFKERLNITLSEINNDWQVIIKS